MMNPPILGILSFWIRRWRRALSEESAMMMRSTPCRVVAAVVGMVLIAGFGLRSRAEEGPPPSRSAAVPTAKGAIEPAAPVLPADVVAAMQDARFDDARRALSALGERAADADD